MLEKALSDALAFGALALVPFVTPEEGEHYGIYTETAGHRCYRLTCKAADYRDFLYLTECDGGYTVKREFKNISDKVLHLKELGVALNGIDLGAAPRSPAGGAKRGAKNKRKGAHFVGAPLLWS